MLCGLARLTQDAKVGPLSRHADPRSRDQSAQANQYGAILYKQSQPIWTHKEQ